MIETESVFMWPFAMTDKETLTWAALSNRMRNHLYTERVALEQQNERLQEYYDASMAVEEGVVSFDLQHEAVERLEKARAAILRQEDK